MPKKPVAVSLRKPQPAAEVDAFVSGAAPVRAIQTAQRPDAEALVQHGSREFREMTLYLPSEIARQLSFYCMDRNCDVNGVVADAVTKLVTPAGTEAEVQVESAPPERLTFESLLQRSRDKLVGLWALRPRTSWI